MNIHHTATAPGRLSTVLKEQMGVSTGLMNRLKWRGAILVNGRPEHTDFPVAAGDEITLLLDAPAPDYPADSTPITILYEDDHLLAVDKPAGLLVHPSRAQLTGTLANRVLGYYRSTGQNSAFHPVTRLDRDTFGIVLLAKNPMIHAKMNTLHTQGLLQKTYHALVYGGPREDSGVIDAPIARRPLPSLLREVRPDGKPSQSAFTVLERQERYCRLALRPLTGRTHQLRLHCAYAGFPILGDPQYTSGEAAAFSAALGLSHQLLCAKALAFPHPVTAQPLLLRSRMDVCL